MMESYLARLLPPNEWHRLGIAPELLPPDPVNTVVIVVENQAGEIIGRWLAYNTVVLEGLHIADAHRKHPGVAGRLMQAMTAELVGRGVPMAVTLIQDGEVARLAHRHGLYQAHGQLWVLDLRRLVDTGSIGYGRRLPDDPPTDLPPEHPEHAEKGPD